MIRNMLLPCDHQLIVVSFLLHHGKCRRPICRIYLENRLKNNSFFSSKSNRSHYNGQNWSYINRDPAPIVQHNLCPFDIFSSKIPMHLIHKLPIHCTIKSVTLHTNSKHFGNQTRWPSTFNPLPTDV